MRRILTATTAIVAGALWFGPTPGFATEIKGSYTISETYTDTGTAHTGGGPTITDMWGTGSPVETTNSSTEAFDLHLTSGAMYTTPVSLASFSPYGTCAGDGCASNLYVDSNVKIAFTFTLPSGATNVGGVIDTATFTARYSSPYLTCDPGGDGAGKSDCIAWASNTTQAKFADGSYLNIILGNAKDWTIYPSVSVQFNAAPVPEPISMSILGVGLAGLGYVRRRKRAVA
jgi:hypothetical protein